MTTDNLKPLRVVCRIEKATKKPAIFYRNPDKFDCLSHALSCYTREEQHSDASIDYYRANTRPAKTAEEQAMCEALSVHYANYCLKYGGERLIIGSRLCC